MNIFYLDSDPQLNVQYYVDKHVVKMIMEYAQLLSTTVRECDGVLTDKVKLLPGETPDQLLYYKSTHVNHPCARWTRQSLSHWRYLRWLSDALNCEWQYRYDHPEKNHKSYDMILSLPVPKNIPDTPFVEPPSCMSEDFIVSDSSVDNYRSYYIHGKSHIHKWTKRPVPEWLS